MVATLIGCLVYTSGAHGAPHPGHDHLYPPVALVAVYRISFNCPNTIGPQSPASARAVSDEMPNYQLSGMRRQASGGPYPNGDAKALFALMLSKSYATKFVENEVGRMLVNLIPIFLV